MRNEYHLNHPETGDVIVIDRMTARDARKRNEALEAMRLPYRWELSVVTLPLTPRSVDVRDCVAA